MFDSRGLGARTLLRKVIRNYNGEFENPSEYLIHPMKSPLLIAYWGLEIVETETAQCETLIHTTVRLASVRNHEVARSEYAESYHHPNSYSRLPLYHVPVEPLMVIAEATGAELLPALTAAP